METRITEVANGIHQLTTYVAEMDFSFNQYLVLAEEPLLFHTGPRQMFPLISDAVSGLVPWESLRWIGFGHVEADECGSMNQWLAAAPRSTVVQGMVGCMVSIGDLADRPPRGLADGEAIDLGGHRMRWIDTPHVPHGWEAGIFYDETTRTLLCGDLFTQTGLPPATTEGDIIAPAIAGEDLFHASSLAPSSGATIRGLAALDIDVLALMHGPAFNGDCKAALLGLADDFDRRISAAASR
ncbi:MAG: MBL fold metallo-hydrolase [Acidimicrobiales bacterium]